jgi:hypothetical protein
MKDTLVTGINRRKRRVGVNSSLQRELMVLLLEGPVEERVDPTDFH